MNIRELGYSKTPLGELTLWRRIETLLGNREVFEVRLGNEYLMSSLFTEAEEQLARLGLAGLEGEIDVVVGGLGLGYTAAEALRNRAVRELLVIDIFQPVIDWHRGALVPVGPALTGDPRCVLRQGDFFGLARSGFDETAPERKFDAVLLDIDHSPKHFLDRSKGSFYGAEGLASAKKQIKPGGSFAMWSDDPADEDFTRHLASVFGSADARNIDFANPYTNSDSVNSVYVARNSI